MSPSSTKVWSMYRSRRENYGSQVLPGAGIGLPQLRRQSRAGHGKTFGNRPGEPGFCGGETISHTGGRVLSRTGAGSCPALCQSGGAGDADFGLALPKQFRSLCHFLRSRKEKLEKALFLSDWYSSGFDCRWDFAGKCLHPGTRLGELGGDGCSLPAQRL